MSESTAKLKVTVKLHPPSLADLPEPGPAPAPPLSVVKMGVAVAVIVLAAYGGRWLYQQRPAAEIDYAAYAVPEDDPAEAAVATQHVAASVPSNRQAPDVFSNTALSEGALSSNELDTSASANQTPAPITSANNASASAALPAATAMAVRASSPAEIPKGFRRLVLTAQMERLEPGAAVSEPVPFASVKRVYLFTEIEGFAGQNLRHRWYWQNQLQYEAHLTVEDSPWRTYSEKWLLDDQRGAWRVEIVDQAQNVLYQHDFTYQ